MNRLLLEMHELDAGGRARLSDHRAAHIRGVLRGMPGMRLKAGIINGPVGHADILDCEPHQVTIRFQPVDDPFDVRLSPLPVDLLLALPRPKTLKRLWPQFSAMGVRRIMLTNASRVERCYFGSRWVLPQFVRPLLIEGAVQAGATNLPTYDLFRRFKDALRADRDDPSPVVRWLGDPGRATGSALLPGRLPFSHDGVRIAIGPEGGWLPHEYAMLGENGYIPISLGPRILRSDTACIALTQLAVLHVQSILENQICALS